MDPSSLQHVLTPSESEQFERDGYFVVPNALPDDLVESLIPVSDEIDRSERELHDIKPEARVNHYDFIGRHPLYLSLLDWPSTFAKVWGILGWHIQLYHSHMTYTPVEAEGRSAEEDGLALGWHQDSGEINRDLEGDPRPRISLKIGYFLSDASQPHRGNFYVLPGSHLHNEFPGQDRKQMPAEAHPVCVPAGSAVFFDRRLWHSGSANYWTEPRRVLFYGYSYRWLRPRDDMTVEHLLPSCDPIRQQLLGVTHSGGRGFTSPTDEDVPLRSWLEEQGIST